MEQPTQSSTTATRSFSTTARISAMPVARRPMPLRWAVPAAAVLFVGAAAHVYRENTADSRRTAAATAAKEEAERLRRNEAIMDMYGTRATLDDLERAASFYGKNTKE